VAADRGLGPDDDDFLILADESGGLSSGLYHAYDRHVRCGRDAVKCQCGRGVARNDQQLGSVGFEVVGGFNSITRNGFDRLGAVGKSGGIAKVEIVGVGNQVKSSFTDGKPAAAGIEYADGGTPLGHGRFETVSR
jgi:hypothetical protein